MAKSGEAVSPVISQIVGTAREVESKINGLKKPEMKFPLRTLANVRYSAKKGHFEMLGKKKERTLTVSTVKTFAQTMRMISLSKQMIDTDERATKRDAYYQTKNWGDARCDEQTESDTILDDVEALFGVKVASVRTKITSKGKKHAVVKLSKGFKADDVAAKLKMIA